MSAADCSPLLALVVCWLLLRLLLGRAWLPLDRPNERSSHAVAVPRIGGVGVVAGVAAGGLLLLPNDLLGLLLLALGLAALSLLDDVRGLPVRLRLAVHTLAGAALVWFLPEVPAWAWWLLLPALVWMTNLYNFMDGADGLAGGMAVIGFSVYGAAAWLGGAESFALLAWAIAAAAAGFLVFNLPPARLFLGDVGSIPLGFLAGGLGLFGWLEGLWSAAFPLLVFSPFVVDASVTLLRRAWRGEKIWQAHREHYYQRLLRLGWSHGRLIRAEYLLMALAGISALAVQAQPAGQAAMLLIWSGVYLALAVAIDRRWRKFNLGA